jgi:hypothetical protein
MTTPAEHVSPCDPEEERWVKMLGGVLGGVGREAVQVAMPLVFTQSRWDSMGKNHDLTYFKRSILAPRRAKSGGRGQVLKPLEESSCWTDVGRWRHYKDWIEASGC